MSTEKKTTVAVVATQASRWRAGMQFGKEPRVVEVTAAQLAQLEADPMLVVAAGEEGEAETDDKKKGKGGKKDA